MMRSTKNSLQKNKYFCPPKLKKGDTAVVVAPAKTLATVDKDLINIVIQRLLELGITVKFGKHAYEQDIFESSPIQSRVQDLHDAYLDKSVKLVIAARGGYNSNQLLNYIDFNIIKNNPKILVGYSDITALLASITAKTGLITFYGPNFNSFAMQKGLDYTIEYFVKMLFEDRNKKNDISNYISVKPSTFWSDDKWWKDQENRHFIKNSGYWVINEGRAEGRIIGGNLCTLNLLQGTKFMPSIKNVILFLEDDDYSTIDANPKEFDRNLQSLLHLPEAKYIKGLVIGRFQKNFGMTRKKLEYIIKTKSELKTVPVIANVDFGHTTPQITLPIGGRARLVAEKGKVKLQVGC